MEPPDRDADDTQARGVISDGDSVKTEQGEDGGGREDEVPTNADNGATVTSGARNKNQEQSDCDSELPQRQQLQHPSSSAETENQSDTQSLQTQPNARTEESFSASNGSNMFYNPSHSPQHPLNPPEAMHNHWMYPPPTPHPYHHHQQHLYPPPHQQQHSAVEAMQLYQDQMQSYAAAYASAAANAAMAAAQVAQAAAEYANGSGPPPPNLFWSHENNNMNGAPPLLPPPPTPPPPLPQHQQPYFPPHPPPPSTAMFGSAVSPTASQPQYPAPPVERHGSQAMPSPVAASLAAGATPTSRKHTSSYPYEHGSFDNEDNRSNKSSSYDHCRKKKRIPRRQHNNFLPPSSSSSRHRTRQHHQQHFGNNNSNSTSNTASNHRVRRRRQFSDNSSSGGGSNSSSYYQYYHTKKPRSDESLLGKTAVGAIHEWCSKRHLPIKFHWLTSSTVSSPNTTSTTTATTTNDNDNNQNRRNEDANNSNSDNNNTDRLLATTTANPQHPFFVSVLVEDIERGRGNGSTKQAAKQAAAKQALLSLASSIVFDESGVVIGLPKNQFHDQQQQGCDDDLPNLAKRLAIRHDNDPLPPTLGVPATIATSSTAVTKKKAKRALDSYPVASTSNTSDCSNSFNKADDANEYYTSRGASVCSSLLHTMVRIDPRLAATPPMFTYTEHSRTQQSIKRHRAYYTCTGTLKVVVPTCGEEIEENKEVSEEQKLPPSLLETEREGNEEVEDGTEKHAKYEGNADSLLENNMTTLQATGFGQSKREARHSTCAKLLAMLFPECKTMVQVKHAAEAKREAHLLLREQQSVLSEVSDLEQPSEASLPFPFEGAARDPNIPIEFQRWLQKLALQGDVLSPNPGSDNGSPRQTCSKDRSSSSSRGCRSEPVFRMASRRDQVNTQIEQALQNYNEHDEEGRSLPEELTVDDVGRTILRQAIDQDLEHVVKLFLPIVDGGVPVEGDGSEHQKHVERERALVSQLKSPSTVVLLLCRVVAPFDDPPLACAVLSRGFSMEFGVHFRLENIANESHAPKERFIECLVKFCKRINHGLMTAESETFRMVPVSDLCSYFAGQLRGVAEEPQVKVNATTLPTKLTPPTILLASPLQSVAEEESSDAKSHGSVEKRATKRPSKPSKRSRVV